jgi:hypothetical protein
VQTYATEEEVKEYELSELNAKLAAAVEMEALGDDDDDEDEVGNRVFDEDEVGLCTS